MFFIILLFASVLRAKKVDIKTDNIYLNNVGFFPDSTFNDSTSLLEDGDTIEIYIDGGDTTYILFQEQSSTIDSMADNLWSFTDDQPHIKITLTDHYNPIQTGLIGVNISDIFETGHANANEIEDIYNTGVAPLDDITPWDQLSGVSPKVIRFPSGAGSKFMQLLGSEYTDDTGDPLYGYRNGGYGYKIEDIYKFYDQTDGTPHIDVPLIGTPWTDVITDMTDFECLTCINWMEGDFIEDFEDFYKKWYYQPKYDPDGMEDLSEHVDLYINDFIQLIAKIESENTASGLRVDVLVCLDILNQTATEAKEMIDYLKDNHIYDLNVVGIELGNESYSKFHRKGAGFEDFDHYYEYINGIDDYSDVFIDDFELEDVLPTDVFADHDFVWAFKSSECSYDIKIGVPGANLSNCGEYPFIIDPRDELEMAMLDPCDYPTWNTDMLDYYDDHYAIGETDRYNFDAIVLHPYYTPSNTSNDAIYENTNWKDIVLPEAGTCLDGDIGDPGIQFYEGVAPEDEWDYEDVDTRLACAFEGVAGYDLPEGNFRDFMRTRYKEAYLEHGENLLFLDGDDDPHNKEIWTTEWNFKDTDEDEVDVDTDPSIEQAMLSTITNSFIHAALLQEWYLKNVKINFDNDFRNEFFTYATAQNFLGGSTINMMGKTDKQDQLEMGIIEDCGDWTTGFVENYYIPKATMFTYDLLSEITKLDLNYVKTTSTMYSLNVNLAPTVFLVPEEHILYFYFTNVKQTYQTYAIDPHDFGEIFGVGFEVDLDFDDIEIYSLNAEQLYSTAGRSSLFKINEAYDGCHDPSGADPLENRFEITETVMDVNSCTCPTGFTPTGAVCVKVPPISSGYFIVKFDVFKKGEMIDVFNIFPNPASTSFKITQKQFEVDRVSEMDIELFTIQGTLVAKQKVEPGQNIDISNLPVGVYSVVITTSGLKAEAEMLVKMK